MENSVETIDVLTLLPQRPPFVMIDRLVHFDEVATTTLLTVRKDNLFMEEGGVLNPCALVENIAQTCAARMGYINKYIYKNKMRLGFIGGIRNLQILRPVRVGEQLTTSIEATVKVGDETIVTAEMKIALSDIESEE